MRTSVSFRAGSYQPGARGGADFCARSVTLYDRSKLRYPSDLSDEEWAFIAPVIPPAKRGGGKRTVNIREVVNGLMYVLSTGCQWRAIASWTDKSLINSGLFYPPTINAAEERLRYYAT